MTNHEAKILRTIKVEIIRLQKLLYCNQIPDASWFKGISRSITLLKTLCKVRGSRKELALIRFEQRYRRLCRLLDLGSPMVVIRNEAERLKEGFTEVEQVFRGHTPKLSYEQKKEILMQWEIEFILQDKPLFSIRNRKYILSPALIGYRL
jgi:hypothetical protein